MNADYPSRWVIIACRSTGCAFEIAPNTYPVGPVGQINRTIFATIISVREVSMGGFADTAIEHNARKQKGFEYVVETENGNFMSIVQGSDPIFAEGQKVLVRYGAPSQIIADPRVKR